MAKLICETNFEHVKSVVEDATPQKPKSYGIAGIMMQSNKPNRNGRLYPSSILQNETNRYVEQYVKPNGAYGELSHPDKPTVNLERASHMIKSLRFEGDNVVGEAKVISTPYGNIVKALIDEGGRIGVSSRALASLHEENGINVVEEDLLLCAIDIVADPSAPDAFVRGVLENKEWVWDNGLIKEVSISNYKKSIQKASGKNKEEVYVKLFSNFLNKI